MHPPVDIVIPFIGAQQDLERLLEAVPALGPGENDSLTVVDNRPQARSIAVESSQVLAAPAVQSSYYARNRGADVGRAEWILFLDADVVPAPDLLDRYFDQAPGGGTAVLAGGVVDEAPADPSARRSWAAAYAYARGHMSQDNTLGAGQWRYAQTANCLVLRSAFMDAGGFVENIRSGGDADLCFRLAAAGWAIESRPEARVVHRARRSLRGLVAQRARHGAGAAWLNRRHPGSFPRRRWAGLAVWSLRKGAGAIIALARGRGEQALLGALEPLDVWAFELGRLFSNDAGRARPRDLTL